jgi:hypothetical protein
MWKKEKGRVFSLAAIGQLCNSDTLIQLSVGPLLEAKDTTRGGF